LLRGRTTRQRALDPPGELRGDVFLAGAAGRHATNVGAAEPFADWRKVRSGTSFAARFRSDQVTQGLRPPLPLLRGSSRFRGCAAGTGGRPRIRSRSSRWNSKNPSDCAGSRSHRTAHDGTDRAGCLTTSLGTVLSTTDCSLSTCNAGSCQHHEQGRPEGKFAHVALHLIDLRLVTFPWREKGSDANIF
jgi:hypothetical protein